MYFKLICFWTCRPNSFMEGDERGNFSKGPDRKILLENLNLWLSQKLNKTLAPSIFKHIHENSRAYSRGKKSPVLVNDWVNIAYWKEQSIARHWQASLVCSKYRWGIWGGVGAPSKILGFVALCKLANSIWTWVYECNNEYEYKHININMNMSTFI